MEWGEVSCLFPRLEIFRVVFVAVAVAVVLCGGVGSGVGLGCSVCNVASFDRVLVNLGRKAQYPLLCIRFRRIFLVFFPQLRAHVHVH